MTDKRYYILGKWNVFKNELVEHVILEREVLNGHRTIHHASLLLACRIQYSVPKAYRSKCVLFDSY